MSEMFDDTSQDTSSLYQFSPSGPGSPATDDDGGDTESPSYRQCQSNLKTLDPILSSSGWTLDLYSDPGDPSGSTWYLVAYPENSSPFSREQCGSYQDSLDNTLGSDPRTAGQWYINCTCSDSSSDPADRPIGAPPGRRRSARAHPAPQRSQLWVQAASDAVATGAS